MGWLAVPRDWLASFGDVVRFCGRVLGEVLGLRVLRFFGEALRQAGILILSRSEEHTAELQSRQYLVCRLLLEKKKNQLVLSVEVYPLPADLRFVIVLS